MNNLQEIAIKLSGRATHIYQSGSTLRFMAQNQHFLVFLDYTKDEHPWLPNGHCVVAKRVQKPDHHTPRWEKISVTDVSLEYIEGNLDEFLNALNDQDENNNTVGGV